jgi:hypothetical protein
MTKNDREFYIRIGRRIDKFKVWLGQALCWHRLRDECSTRTGDWGHIMEDKYTCIKCRATIWIRRRKYENGSWIKETQ